MAQTIPSRKRKKPSRRKEKRRCRLDMCMIMAKMCAESISFAEAAHTECPL